MKIKQLVWRDTVNVFGKKEGLVDIKSTVHFLDLRYTIRNYKDNTISLITPKKYYLFGSFCFDDILYKETTTIAKAKELAQKNFKKVVMETFFEKD